MIRRWSDIEVSEDWVPAHERAPHAHAEVDMERQSPGWQHEVDTASTQRRRRFVEVSEDVLNEIAATVEKLSDPITRGDEDYFRRVSLVASELEAKGVTYDPKRFEKFLAAIEESAGPRSQRG